MLLVVLVADGIARVASRVAMASRASIVAICQAILVASRLVTSSVGVAGLPPQATNKSISESHNGRFIDACP
jgi:hypothetical protein